MKVSHPRFLSIGSVEHLDMKYPACLQKRTESKQTGPMSLPREGSGSVFLFPNVGTQCTFDSFYNENVLNCCFLLSYIGFSSIFQYTIIQKDCPLSWPLWFHAAVPGNISLYIILYYEIEDAESIMKYRTLRMFHNMEVTCLAKEFSFLDLACLRICFQ